MSLTHRLSLLPAVLLLLGCLEEAQAIPAFARQTGLECMMCHAQNQTKLNGFGRNFARSAYTMSSESGAQSLIDGEALGLGIPMVLNMSLMLKGRFEKSEGAINGKGRVLETNPEGEPIDSNRGIHEVFKTSTLNVAGRVANNAGAIIEFREHNGKAIIGGKAAAAFEMGSGYGGLSLFSTNNYGPFTGMESYNTGLYKPLRQFENHKLTNAIQAADLGSGAATGVQLYYGGENLFMTLGAYVPAHNPDGIDIGSSLIPFARIAYEQPIGEITLIAGAYGIKGSAKASNTVIDPSLIGFIDQALVEIEKEAYGVDLQLEGDIAEVSTMLTLTAVLKNTTTLSDPYLMGDPVQDIYGEPSDADTQAYSIDLCVHPWPVFGLKAAYLRLDDRGEHPLEPDKIDAKDKAAFTVGFDYSFRQNIMATMEYSIVDAKREDVDNYNDLLAVVTIAF